MRLRFWKRISVKKCLKIQEVGKSLQENFRLFTINQRSHTDKEVKKTRAEKPNKKNENSRRKILSSEIGSAEKIIGRNAEIIR